MSNLTTLHCTIEKIPSKCFVAFFRKKIILVLEQFWNFCQKLHVQGYLVSNLWEDIFICFLLMKDFQNFWTKISPNLAKFVWEVPYSVPYATGLDNGGNLYVWRFSFHLVLLWFRNWIKPFWFFENWLIITYS